MKRIIVLTIICTVALLGCRKKDKEPNREPVSTTSLTESSVVSENTSYIEEEVDGIKIDENIFPDEIFREYIKSKIDKDKNEYLSDEEIENVKKIHISGLLDEKYYELKNLKGINIFSNLEILSCQYCNLKDLDVSNNQKLEVLNIGNTDIRDLDLSNNLSLTQLYCGKTNIDFLNISNNTKIQCLDISNTSISNIDISNNTMLERLYCDGTKIVELDLSKNVLLWDLSINNTDIKELDVSNNKELKYFSCFNVKTLSYIDFSNNNKIGSIECKESSIEVLDLTNCENIFEVRCDEDMTVKGCEETIIFR